MNNIYMFDGHDVVERSSVPLWQAWLVGAGIAAFWLAALAIGFMFWWPLLTYSWGYWFG